MKGNGTAEGSQARLNPACVVCGAQMQWASHYVFRRLDWGVGVLVADRGVGEFSGRHPWWHYHGGA